MKRAAILLLCAVASVSLASDHSMEIVDGFLWYYSLSDDGAIVCGVDGPSSVAVPSSAKLPLAVESDRGAPSPTNWEKRNQILVVAFGAGKCAFGTRWVADGEVATATIVPAVELFAVWKRQ